MVRSGTNPRPRCSIASAQPARRRQMRPENLVSGEGALGSGPMQPWTLLMIGRKSGLRSVSLAPVERRRSCYCECGLGYHPRSEQSAANRARQTLHGRLISAIPHRGRTNSERLVDCLVHQHHLDFGAGSTTGIIGPSPATRAFASPLLSGSVCGLSRMPSRKCTLNWGFACANSCMHMNSSAVPVPARTSSAIPVWWREVPRTRFAYFLFLRSAAGQHTDPSPSHTQLCSFAVRCAEVTSSRACEARPQGKPVAHISILAGRPRLAAPF